MMRTTRARRSAPRRSSAIALRVYTLMAVVGLVAGEALSSAVQATPPPLPPLSDTEHVQVPGYGGVMLDGYVRRPPEPAGTRVPVILWESAYFGNVFPMPSSPAAETVYEQLGVPIDFFLQHGYAVAMFSVRGTGNSQGCMDFWGPDEQRDQVPLVNWLAAQPWSTGRVGMFGDSYDATVDLEAAVQAPPALRAVIAVAPVPDPYQMFTTPQGALWTSAAQVPPAFTAIGAVPGADPQTFAADPVGAAGTRPRLCPQTQPEMSDLLLDPVSSRRDAAFWQERDLVPRLSRVRAATLYTDGYYDDEYFEGEKVFGEFTHAPFAYIVGPWPHQNPPATPAFYQSAGLPWFDHYLKATGPTPAIVGSARWRDADVPGTSMRNVLDQATGGDGTPSGTWHTSAAWPPPEAELTPFYLAPDGSLATTQSAGTRSYTSLPSADGTSSPLLGPGGWYTPKTFVCPTPDALSGVDGRVLYQTPPATASGLVAGNPSVDLDVTSSADAGIVSVYLVDLPPGFCSSDGPENAALLSLGAADLRYRDGGYVAQPFPVGTPTTLHIDMTAIAQVIAPGHSLALIVGEGNGLDRQSTSLPQITVDGASRLELPLVRPFAAASTTVGVAR